VILARRTQGADGKDYRANSVHAPFSEKSAGQALSTKVAAAAGEPLEAHVKRGMVELRKVT